MIIYLPVSRFRVPYQLASGRPFSQFEQLILIAVSKGQNSLDDLQKLFCLHRRVVIEGIITLMQAGWLAIETHSDRFIVTENGQVALRENRLPPASAIRERVANIVMERVEGQLAEIKQVNLRRKDVIEKADPEWRARVVPLGNIRNALAEGAAMPLLSRKAGEWIKSIGQSYRAAEAEDFIPVDVELTSDGARLMGIPSVWEARLKDAVVDCAVKLERSSASIPVEASNLIVKTTDAGNEGVDEWRMEVSSEDILVGKQAHLRLLRDYLERAKSFVLISSASLQAEAIEDLKPAFYAALNRGVSVNVLWGREPASVQAKDHDVARSKLAILVKGIRPYGEKADLTSYQGSFTANARALGSSACFVLADPDGLNEMVLGSCDWLATDIQDQTVDSLSIRLRHPYPIARIAHVLAFPYERDDGLRFSPSADILRNIAAEAGEMSVQEEEADRIETAGEEQDIKARLLFDREHEIVFDRVIAAARKTLRIGTSRWSDTSPLLPRLIKILEERGDSLRVRLDYASFSGDRNLWQDAYADLQKQGVDIRQTDGFRANYVIADKDTVVFTSFNWMSQMMSSRLPVGREVGILLEGKGIGERVFVECGERRISREIAVAL